VAWAVSAKASGLLRALSDAARDEHGSTCLHRLLGLRHHLGCIIAHRLTHQLLWDAVRCGANPDARDTHGRSALHTAAMHGHSGAAHVLAAAGGDVHLRDG
jgi:ankyrin repeat protein